MSKLKLQSVPKLPLGLILLGGKDHIQTQWSHSSAPYSPSPSAYIHGSPEQSLRTEIITFLPLQH